MTVNGVESEPFKVIRGVRQGDPLSCLLFILAIEPLACMLRGSDLKGYTIPGVTERLITTLFADDTTVYLSADDAYNDLWKILDKWCFTARAQFNKSKTQIIPIGTQDYRVEVVRTRRVGSTGHVIPSDTMIADNRVGQVVRILGTWGPPHSV